LHNYLAKETMIAKYSMMITWSEEDSAFLVHLPEFPEQHYVTHGSTYEEAARHGQEVIESFIELYQEDGLPLPPLATSTAA
jgi:antitoxin HicB